MSNMLRLKLTLVAACVAALTVAAPAHAVWTSNPAGYVGYWAGSQSRTFACVEHQNLIFHAGPSIGRTSAYPSSIQTIWIQPRVERLYTDGRYYVDSRLNWLAVNTAPGQVATYGRSWNTGDFVVRANGIYRVTYDVRWYVGGRQVGSIVYGHHDSEINIDWFAQRIVSNGCTMNVGVVWVG